MRKESLLQKLRSGHELAGDPFWSHFRYAACCRMGASPAMLANVERRIGIFLEPGLPPCYSVKTRFEFCATTFERRRI